MMNKFFRLNLAVLCLAALSAAGCSFASLASKPGSYSVSGYTTSPEMAMSVASDNYVQERNAEEYWQAVREGRAYPYPGGGQGNDYWYYYGSYGYMPNVVVPEQAVPLPGGNYATQEDVRRVEEKANDSIRMHRRLRQRLQQPDAGASQ